MFIPIGDGHTVCPYCKSSLLENANEDNKRTAAINTTTTGDNNVNSNEHANNSNSINIDDAVVPDIESATGVVTTGNTTSVATTTATGVTGNSDTLLTRFNSFLTGTSSRTQHQAAVANTTSNSSRSNSVRGATVTAATSSDDNVHAQQHVLN
jgi:hypothetical protein